MVLTDHEREFLAAFVYEATTDSFKGPATAALHQRDIYYTDLSHLLTAYSREESRAQEGFGGRRNPAPPLCPWENRETALRRDREAEAALEKTADQPVS